MSQCLRVTNNGNVKISNDLEGFCTEFVMVAQTELDALVAGLSAAGGFDISQLDLTIIASMYGAGWALVGIPWAGAFGASVLLNLIRKG